MSKLHNFFQAIAPHKYAIQSKLLGDDAELAWTNLGDWSASSADHPLTYPQACENLAHRLAQSLNLNSTDRMLDLGCGQGASLQLWQQHYAVQQLEAVELQPNCVFKIQQRLPQLNAIHQLDFLNLKHYEFEKFDAVVCIDAAYHVALNSFLHSVNSVLNSKARLGFHTLMWSEQFLNSNFLRKQRYRMLLKAADVDTNQLMTREQLYAELTQAAFEQIEIVDLSEAVLKGFSEYIAAHCPQNVKSLDGFKISMTAKLCQKLYAEGLLRYVQVTAHKI